MLTILILRVVSIACKIATFNSDLESLKKRDIASTISGTDNEGVEKICVPDDK
jgi:hypothetical protein